jgi:poly(3-hydroxybutyrate) depolymerase
MKVHYVQPGVGHYGVFNGTRWRTEIQPRIREFIRTIDEKRREARTASEPRLVGEETVSARAVQPEPPSRPNGRFNGASGHYAAAD